MISYNVWYEEYEPFGSKSVVFCTPIHYDGNYFGFEGTIKDRKLVALEHTYYNNIDAWDADLFEQTDVKLENEHKIYMISSIFSEN